MKKFILSTAVACTLALITSNSHALSRPLFHAWVWASNPTASVYTPSAYSYVSNLGAITARRSGTGVYSITLGGFEEINISPHVVAYGTNANRCKIANWVRSGDDLEIGVRCHTPEGQPADSVYAFMATSEPEYKGGWLWSSRANASGAAMSLYSHNTTGATNRVERMSTGRYRAYLPGLGDPGGHVQVTSYGTDAAYCNATYWGPSDSDERIDVSCFDGAGRRADSRFNLLFLTDDVSDFYIGAFAWLDRDDSSYTPSGRYSFNTEDASISAARLSTGRYTVSFSERSYQNVGVAVSAYADNGNYCKVEQWRGGTSMTTVYTRCYTPSGVAVDSDYSAMLFGGIATCVSECDPSGICSITCS